MRTTYLVFHNFYASKQYELVAIPSVVYLQELNMNGKQKIKSKQQQKKREIFSSKKLTLAISTGSETDEQSTIPGIQSSSLNPTSIADRKTEVPGAVDGNDDYGLVDVGRLNFSQATVSKVIDEPQWNWSDKKYGTNLMQVVRFRMQEELEDVYTSYDNKRLLSALRAEKEKVKVAVISSDQTCETTKFIMWGVNEYYRAQIYPKNYGVLINLRCAQNENFPLQGVTTHPTPTENRPNGMRVQQRMTSKDNIETSQFWRLANKADNVYISDSSEGVYYPIYDFKAFTDRIDVVDFCKLKGIRLKAMGETVDDHDFGDHRALDATLCALSVQHSAWMEIFLEVCFMPKCLLFSSKFRYLKVSYCAFVFRKSALLN